MEKICTTCKEYKDISEFAKNSSRKDGLQNVCKPCKNAYNADYYDRTKHIHNPGRQERKREYRDMVRSYVLDYLLVHPCVDCGEADPVVLQFDHQHDKLAHVSDMMKHMRPLKLIQEEIEKCEVRCANCHTRRTAKQFGWYKLPKHCSDAADS